MKTMKGILVTGVLALTFMSCEKCYTCEKDDLTGTDTKTVCDGPTEADDRAENLEADGYACTVQ